MALAHFTTVWNCERHFPDGDGGEYPDRPTHKLRLFTGSLWATGPRRQILQRDDWLGESLPFRGGVVGNLAIAVAHSVCFCPLV